MGLGWATTDFTGYPFSTQAAIHEGCDQDNTDRWRPAFSVADLNKKNNMNLCEACQILDLHPGALVSMGYLKKIPKHNRERFASAPHLAGELFF